MDVEVVRDNLITLYFRMGLSNAEICNCLLMNNSIGVSERTVKRRLRRLHLFRRRSYSDDAVVETFILETLQGAGRMHGYRWMYLKCLHHGLTVTQETVRQLMSLLDPEGVAFRKRRRLRRRSYYTAGPNAVWHMDGYDKLKRYGIAIHGCIDGFSRHIIWLRADKTNNDPRVIAGYFVHAVELYGGCPRKIRSDLGTENVYVEQMQVFLREEQDSYIYGTSVHNQRIESWWGILRRQTIQFWINLCEELKEEDQFSGSFLDKALIQFCFLNLIQMDLDEIAAVWDCHSIRRLKNVRAYHGRPYMMFTCPQLYNTVDYLCLTDDMKVQFCKQECVSTAPIPCDETVFELCCAIMQENAWDFPTGAQDACELYINLRMEIIRLL